MRGAYEAAREACSLARAAYHRAHAHVIEVSPYAPTEFDRDREMREYLTLAERAEEEADVWHHRWERAVGYSNEEAKP